MASNFGKVNQLLSDTLILQNGTIDFTGSSVSGLTLDNDEVTIQDLTVTGTLTSSATGTFSGTNTFGNLRLSGNTLSSTSGNVVLAPSGDVRITSGNITVSSSGTFTTNGAVAITDSTTADGSTNGALHVTGGIKTDENLYVSGNLTVLGSTTESSSETVTFEDNLLVVNSAPSAAGRDGGFLVHRFQTENDSSLGDVIADTAKESGTVVAAVGSTITLAAGASAVDDNYNNWYVYIDSGLGSGQVRQITDYDGTTKIATINSAWTVAPIASTYELYNQPFIGFFWDESANELVLASTTSDPGTSPVIAQELVPLSVGALNVEGATTYDGSIIIDFDDSEAFLVRADGDAGDVLAVNTLTGAVTVTGSLAVDSLNLNGSVLSSSANVNLESASGSSVTINRSLYFLNDTAFTAIQTGGDFLNNPYIYALDGAGSFTDGDLVIQAKETSSNDIYFVTNGAIQMRLEGGGLTKVVGRFLGQSTAEASSISNGAIQTDGGVSVTKQVYAGGRIITDDTTNATSTTDGSIQTDGGLSVAQAVYAGGAITTDDATDASDTTSGSIQTDGGLGVVKSAFFGGNLDVAGFSDIGSYAAIGGAAVSADCTFNGSRTWSTSASGGFFDIAGDQTITGSTTGARGHGMRLAHDITYSGTGGDYAPGPAAVMHLRQPTFTATGGDTYTPDVIATLYVENQPNIVNTSGSVSGTAYGAYIGGAARFLSTVDIDGVVSVADATESTTVGTGSVQLTGGAGVAKSITLGENLYLATTKAVAFNGSSDASFRIQHNKGVVSGTYVTGDSLDITASDTANEGILFQTDTSLILELGSDTNTYAHGRILVEDATDASSTTNGSLQTDGGLSVAKAGYFGGRIITDDATDATNTTDGSIQTDGGLSVAKDIFCGAEVNAGELTVDNININGNTISSTSGTITLAPATSFAIDNISLDSNDITTTVTNGDIDIFGNGSGDVNIGVSGASNGGSVAANYLQINSPYTAVQSSGGFASFPGFYHLNNPGDSSFKNGDLVMQSRDGDFDLYFRTNNTTRMVVTGSGEIGIGNFNNSAAPSALLDVVGTARMENKLVSTIAATTTLTAADSGKVIFINASAASRSITLPSPASGLHFEFYFVDATNSNGSTIATASAANILSGTIVNGGAAINANSNNTLTFQVSTTEGDYVKMVSDGTRWLMHGVVLTAGSVVVT